MPHNLNLDKSAKTVPTVIYSHKKQIHCKHVPTMLRYVSKMDSETGVFKTQEVVVPARTECVNIDISICGTIASP